LIRIFSPRSHRSSSQPQGKSGQSLYSFRIRPSVLIVFKTVCRCHPISARDSAPCSYPPAKHLSTSSSMMCKITWCASCTRSVRLSFTITWPSPRPASDPRRVPAGTPPSSSLPGSLQGEREIPCLAARAEEHQYVAAVPKPSTCLLKILSKPKSLPMHVNAVESATSATAGSDFLLARNRPTSSSAMCRASAALPRCRPSAPCVLISKPARRSRRSSQSDLHSLRVRQSPNNSPLCRTLSCLERAQAHLSSFSWHED